MFDSPIIELDSIDSTNNYAMRLIDADKAQHGLTVIAQSQTGGKGQRGRTWVDMPGQSLLMSMIVVPGTAIGNQFVFNAAVAVAVADVLKKLDDKWQLRIKWPNDIIINDKKAGGILIENVLRGNKWCYCVIGLGLNVKQEQFPGHLPVATSLKIETGRDNNITAIRDRIRQEIAEAAKCLTPAEAVMRRYNSYLYKRGEKQAFSNESGKWDATIMQAEADGSLQAQMKTGEIVKYYHGQVVWRWQTTEP